MNIIRLITLLAISWLCTTFAFGKNNDAIITGKISCTESGTIEYATISLSNTQIGTYPNEKGIYSLSAPSGKYKLTAKAIGYKTFEKEITIKAGSTYIHDIVMETDAALLEEVLVTGKSAVRQVNETAYNVVAIDAKPLHNSTLDLSHALDRISGVRVRENGGVGSGFNFSLNGFTGRQVKFFIDGIPMENFGSSFQINNIPINLADRIEVYKGVVPVSFGADALGGAVNIVTSSQKNKYIDVSYSYGSFNTHRSYINAGFTDKSGFLAELNAFQNYSDNDYKVDVDVADLNTGLYTKQEVKRFHDNYHNETVIANLGVAGKKFADKMLFGITLGKNKADIQTAARMDRVFGARFRRGEIIMPTFKYTKKNLFLEGLDVYVTGNYNLGYEQTVDTVARQYNWLGDYKEKPQPGSELSRTMYKYKNNNGVFTGNFSYRISEQHSVMLNNVYNTFDRKGSDELYPDNESYNQPRKTQKNVIGGAYKYDYHERWNTSVFLKYFYQQTTSFVTVEGSGGWGTTEYKKFENTFDALGYGLASTYFVKKGIQVKVSYEKSFRLPENEELFGDANTLQGNLDLKPESSDNVNLGGSFQTSLGKEHGFFFDMNLIYRNAKDYIRPQQNTNGTHQVMTNQRDVKNWGFNGEVKYSFSKFLTAGLNATYQNLRNNTRYEEGANIESTVYKDRIPNMPYLFGNGNLSLFFDKVGSIKNTLTVGYNLLYVHEYYLKWPSQGTASSKYTIPTQVSQDIHLTYAISDGRYNISLECNNIADTNLYDNFSLQKPGRSFAAKFRYFFNN